MKGWKYEKGYEGKNVVNPRSVDLTKLKTDRDFITAYAELSKASHWRKDKRKGNLAWKLGRNIVDIVRARLEGAGWHAHIFATGSCECQCSRDMYLYQLAGLPEVSEVPFSGKINIELTEEELFREDGSLRKMDESLALLRKRIGGAMLDLDEMAEGEIAPGTAEIIRAIMEEEGLAEVHEVDEDRRTFRSGPKEFTWRDNDDEAAREARKHLMDGELWREAVKAEKTEQSLEDWVDDVLSIDGWEPELCAYDGCSHTLEKGVVYWRTN